MVCRSYKPPAGYVPTMANPLLELKYGKIRTTGDGVGLRDLRHSYNNIPRDVSFNNKSNPKVRIILLD